jgi:hypothetical protein
VKKQASAFPLSVSRGNITVKIYRVGNAASGGYFQICYYVGGRRKVETHTELEAAKTAARLAADKLHAGEGELLTLSSVDRLRYLQAQESLEPFQLTVDAAVTDYAACLSQLQGKAGERVVWDCACLSDHSKSD